MTRSKVKDSSSRSLRSEMCGNDRFQKLSSANMHVIKRLMVNYDTAISEF